MNSKMRAQALQTASLWRLEVPSLLRLLLLLLLLLRVHPLCLLRLQVSHILLTDLLLQMGRQTLEVGHIHWHTHHHALLRLLLLRLIRLRLLARRRCSSRRRLLQAGRLEAKVGRLTLLLLRCCKVRHGCHGCWARCGLHLRRVKGEMRGSGAVATTCARHAAHRTRASWSSLVRRLST